MHHWMITEIEKLRINDQLKAEELCAKKASFYLNQSRDPAVRAVLQQCIDKGQRHVSALSGLLQEAGLTNIARH